MKLIYQTDFFSGGEFVILLIRHALSLRGDYQIGTCSFLEGRLSNWNRLFSGGKSVKLELTCSFLEGSLSNWNKLFLGGKSIKLELFNENLAYLISSF